MMNTANRILSVALVLGSLGSTSLMAAPFRHVDSLAGEIRDRANDVCWELYRNCRHQPAFRETYRDAKEMWSIGGHIHDLVHNSSNPSRVQRNAIELAELLAGIRQQVEEWNGGEIYEHEHACSFRLKRKLAALEEAVAHLLDDVGVRNQPNAGPAYAPVMASPAAVAAFGPEFSQGPSSPVGPAFGPQLRQGPPPSANPQDEVAPSLETERPTPRPEFEAQPLPSGGEGGGFPGR